MAHRKNPHLVMVMNPGTPVSERRAWNDVVTAAIQVRQDATKPEKVREVSKWLEKLARLMRSQVIAGVHANPGGEKFSNHVQAIVYEHVTEGPRAHGFGNADPDLRTHGRTLSMTGLKEKTDVAMYAMPDGSIHIRGGRGQRLWRKDR